MFTSFVQDNAPPSNPVSRSALVAAVLPSSRIAPMPIADGEGS